MVGLSKMMALVLLVFLCSQISAQRYLRSAVPLNDINVDVKADDNSRRGHAGGEEAERLKRHVDPLNAINIDVNAVDNSKHGDGHGQQEADGHQPGHVEHPEPEAPASEESERMKRQAPRLSDINIGVNATDNSKHGGGGRKGGPKIPVGPGPVHPSSPNGGSNNEEPADPDVPENPAGDDNFAVIGAIGPNGDGHWPEQSQSEGQRLKRHTPRLDDINIDVKAVDNSYHGASGGYAGGDEAERLKRQAAPLSAINIGVDAVDNSKNGAGRGTHGAGGHQPSRPVEKPEAEAASGEESERLKRQVPTRLDDINIKVNAVDNSQHGAGAGRGGAAGGQEGPEGEEAGRLARRG